jgi:hypothetical protein
MKEAHASPQGQGGTSPSSRGDCGGMSGMSVLLHGRISNGLDYSCTLPRPNENSIYGRQTSSVSNYSCGHLCIYVSMYLCIYVSMHVCIYVSMHVCIYACMYVCMYVSSQMLTYFSVA